MNKYQEALDEIIDAMSKGNPNFKLMIKNSKQIKIIQELIDKHLDWSDEN